MRQSKGERRGNTGRRRRQGGEGGRRGKRGSISERDEFVREREVRMEPKTGRTESVPHLLRDGDPSVVVGAEREHHADELRGAAPVAPQLDCQTTLEAVPRTRRQRARRADQRRPRRRGGGIGDRGGGGRSATARRAWPRTLRRAPVAVRREHLLDELERDRAYVLVKRHVRVRHETVPVHELTRCLGVLLPNGRTKITRTVTLLQSLLRHAPPQK
eukprot:4747188-Pleurochrysis_carterae.AAC.6